jgi:hypothetical protein
VRWRRLALTRSAKGVGMRREGSRVPTGRHAHLSSAVGCRAWAEEELGQEWTEKGLDKPKAASP